MGMKRMRVKRTMYVAGMVWVVALSSHGTDRTWSNMLGGPFETFQAIKNDVKKAAKSQIPLVMSFTNDYFGYAPDKETAEGYAAKTVPMILGHQPFANIHEELANVLLELDRKLLQ